MIGQFFDTMIVASSDNDPSKYKCWKLYWAALIHARADVNNMADLVTKLSNIPPTFLRDFLAPEEEDTRFLNVLEEEFVFVSAICI